MKLIEDKELFNLLKLAYPELTNKEIEEKLFHYIDYIPKELNDYNYD